MLVCRPHSGKVGIQDCPGACPKGCLRFGNTGAAWKRILGAVNSFADLEPELLGRVEELIDFVTAPEE